MLMCSPAVHLFLLQFFGMNILPIYFCCFFINSLLLMNFEDVLIFCYYKQCHLVICTDMNQSRINISGIAGAVSIGSSVLGSVKLVSKIFVTIPISM